MRARLLHNHYLQNTWQERKCRAREPGHTILANFLSLHLLNTLPFTLVTWKVIEEFEQESFVL